MNAKLQKLDSYLKKTVESITENPTITTSVLKIPQEHSEKNNVTDVYQNINNTDDCDILLSKNMENICTKQYPTDIANYTQKSVLSVDDKKCIVENGPCRPSGPSILTRVDDILTNRFITQYQKLDCVFCGRGFAIHQSSKNVTANLVGFSETIVLSTKSGYEDLMIGPVHHEELNA
ncbi:Uncharacterized protein FWK35_00031036 [Aphis craccivora]|uniref:Uncharacterized protein n=1 Tax=Aphis craccivora TaxID=307492 RepID=A0A6G0VXW5_APHCR|nr:Uncharacterized protein FWK35_00031036 [Aphis craccivora]